VHTRETGLEKITIFTRSNWKWFSKQVIVSQVGRIACFTWGSKFAQIVVIGASGDIQVIEFNLVYHSCMASCNLGTDESGYTTVVDGVNLNLTPLGKMVMPPPMFEK
jgi:hypothetical protein